jgi:outer membrane protein TolC
MNQKSFSPKYFKLVITAVSLAVLSGCVSVNFEQSLATTNQTATDFTQGQLSLAQTKEQRDAQGIVAAEILQKPIGQSDAVRLALVNSPALQAMLAQNWADAARAAQTGRIANPVLSFERLTSVGELDIGRKLSFGLLDLLTLPQRYGIAKRQVAAAQLRLTNSVIEQVTQVRGAWVTAVAAQQNLIYARQVNEAAQASAELARRMLAAGNFTKLQRARQQAFYADSATGLAAAQHASTSAREKLVRLLGLTDTQAAELVLPARLPDMPRDPRSPDEVGKLASSARLDLKLAQAEFEGAAKAQGLSTVTTFTDIELGVKRETKSDLASGTSTLSRSHDISVRIPIFDWGGIKRDAMNAQTLAAANRLEAITRAAGSNLRESYSAYRTAFDVSRHYRDEVVPLRKTISEENVLRYNGMLIGVFELLADSRDQVSSVMAAIAAEQQFWLADAALQASLMGKPTMAFVGVMAASGGSDAKH